MPPPSPRRIAAACLLVVLLAAGLMVHAALPDTTASDIAGDILYAVAVYTAAVCVLPRLTPLAVAGVTAGWGVAVELFQLTGLPERVGDVFPPAVLVLGTVFDPRDLVIAAATPCAAATVDHVLLRAARRRPSFHHPQPRRPRDRAPR